MSVSKYSICKTKTGKTKKEVVMGKKKVLYKKVGSSTMYVISKKRHIKLSVYKKMKMNKTNKKIKTKKSAKSNKSNMKYGGTPYTFPNFSTFKSDFVKKNYKRLVPMPANDGLKLIGMEYQKELDRIRKKYVYENFNDLNDSKKKELIINLKKAEEFTPPKKGSFSIFR